MATNKKTAREFYMELKKVAVNQDQVDFLNHQIDLLDRKRANKGQTARQVENEELKKIIVETLTKLGKAVVISELQNANRQLKEYNNTVISNQRITNLLTHLVNEGEVVRTVEKGKAYFSVD